MVYLFSLLFTFASPLYSAAPASEKVLEMLTVQASDGQVKVPKGYFEAINNCAGDLSTVGAGSEDTPIPLSHYSKATLQSVVNLMDGKCERRDNVFITENMIEAFNFLGPKDKQGRNEHPLSMVYAAWLKREKNRKEPVHRGDTGAVILEQMGMNSKEFAADITRKSVEFTDEQKEEIDFRRRPLCICNKMRKIENYQVRFRFSQIELLHCLPDLVNPQIVTYLSFHGNRLTSIEPRAFKLLLNLESLILSKNKLTIIKSGLFNGLSKLKRFNFFCNQISIIESGSFNGLSELEDLNLSGNQILIIESGLFNGLSELKNLNLSRNRLTEDNQGAIKDFLPKVKVSL